jgi:hypothetical protein
MVAGAKRLLNPVPRGMSVDDGWLPAAEEVSQLDRYGTSLAPLSA